jgi:hypothetical protein
MGMKCCTHARKHAYLQWMCVCLCMYMYMCVYIYVCVYIYYDIFVYVCLYVCINICIYMCVYNYVLVGLWYSRVLGMGSILYLSWVMGTGAYFILNLWVRVCKPYTHEFQTHWHP